MTQNQIAYWNLQEAKQHNRVTERETERHNQTTEGETARLNSGQLNRWSHQNKTDTANAVTGGIANVSSALFGKSGLVGTITNIVGGASKAVTGLIGFGG